jgi:hypothetical protein
MFVITDDTNFEASRNRCGSTHSNQNGASFSCYAIFKAVDTCTFYGIHNIFRHTHNESDPVITGARQKVRVPQLQSPHTQWKKGDFFLRNMIYLTPTT